MSEDAFGLSLTVGFTSPFISPLQPGTDLGLWPCPLSTAARCQKTGTVSVCTRELEEVWPHGVLHWGPAHLVTVLLPSRGQR